MHLKCHENLPLKVLVGEHDILGGNYSFETITAE